MINMIGCKLPARPTESQMTNQSGLTWSLNSRWFFFFPNNFFPGFDVFVSGGKLIREVSEEKEKKKSSNGAMSEVEEFQCLQEETADIAVPW